MKHLICLTVLACLATASNAETITVCLDGSCDYTDIQEAINAASDGDVIEIAAGTYYPAESISTIGKPVTLRGVPGKSKDGTPATVIDGQDSIFNVLRCVSGEGADTVFENLLITGGNANYGAGMYNADSSPSLINCTFASNTAYYGGGMYNFRSSPALISCAFEGNSSAEHGGGMANSQKSSPTLTGCTFTNNSADYGGGMHNRQASLPTLINCSFTENLAVINGGGMRNEGNSSPTLTDTTVCNNTP
ncbi:MAG: hypothetical protein MK085_07310, partial [Phycisphaerales bacterium]|nr:hypothetical protein [Phycisphaerales bacterium]